MRVLEMSLLRDINPHEESEEYKNWRLQVKQRLYNHNIVSSRPQWLPLILGYSSPASKGRKTG